LTVRNAPVVARRKAVIDHINENYRYRDSQIVISFQKHIAAYLAEKAHAYVSKTTWEIIYFLCSGLYSNATVAVSDIYSSIDVSKTAVIRCLNRLEARRIIEKNHDPADKRRRLISFTDAFAKQVAAAADECAHKYGDIIRELEPILTAGTSDRLHERLAKIEEYAEVSSDWFWETDENHQFTWFSESLSAHINYNYHRTLGSKRSDYHVPVTARERLEIERHFEDLDAGRPFRDFVYRVSFDDYDGFVWCAITGNPIFDEEGNFRGYFGSGRDVTERHESLEVLQRNEERLRRFNDLAVDWSWVLDRDYRYTWYSNGRRSLVNGFHQELRGSLLWECFSPGCTAGRQRHKKLRDDLTAQRPFYDVLSRVVDGPQWNVVWHSNSGIPVFDTVGEFEGYHGVCIDVTRQTQTRISHSSQKSILEKLVRGQPASPLIPNALDIIEKLRPGLPVSLYLQADGAYPLYRGINGGERGCLGGKIENLSDFVELQSSSAENSVIVTEGEAETQFTFYRLPLTDGSKHPDRDAWLVPFCEREGTYQCALVVAFDKQTAVGDVEKSLLMDVCNLIELIVETSPSHPTQSTD